MSVLVGAVAYDPKAVTIWEVIRDLFKGDLDFVLFSNYEAQVDALFRGAIDIAWNTPVAWVRCKKRSSGKARPLVMRDTDVGFTCKIIAKESLKGSALADLRGKRVALGSRDSAQAAILPAYYLAKSGVSHTSLRFDIDVGKHGDTGTSELEVLRAIEEGRADAGAVGGTLPTPPGMKVLWTSPPFSHCNFTALPNLEERRAKAFELRLLSMEYSDPAVKRMMDLEGLKKWVAGRTTGYEDLERAMEEQGLL